MRSRMFSAAEARAWADVHKTTNGDDRTFQKVMDEIEAVAHYGLYTYAWRHAIPDELHVYFKNLGYKVYTTIDNTGSIITIFDWRDSNE